MTQTLTVVHLITGLGQGGAEAVLVRLVTNSCLKHIVISFTDRGVYGDGLERAGVEVYTLGMKPGKMQPKDFLKLVKLLRTLHPDVVQTWMYHADFLGGLAARLAGVKHIAWGIRNSGYQLKETSRSAYYFSRLSAMFSSRLPQVIVACGEEAARRHQDWGYDRQRMVVIPNGYDLSRWHAQPQAAAALRYDWGVSASTPLIGFVARWNYLKDHANLIAAFAQVKRRYADARCVLVGKDMQRDNADLVNLIQQSGLSLDNDFILLGMRDDVAAILSAIDLHVLSSRAEGFPNVVAEAMACETPSVVTDVGDATIIVGELGWVAEPENANDLAQKIILGLDSVLAQTPEQVIARGLVLRQQVIDRFSLAAMVNHYEQTWQKMVGQRN